MPEPTTIPVPAKVARRRLGVGTTKSHESAEIGDPEAVRVGRRRRAPRTSNSRYVDTLSGGDA